MNDLKRIEGKTIKTVDQDFDGVNSYIIIKFKEGGKVNISSYPNGDGGVGQLDVELGELQPEDLIGKRIHSVTEEFDGANDFIVFTFKDTTKITITSFCSAEDSTAGLDITVYSAPDKLVAESLDELFENKYLQWGEYSMSQPQYESGEEEVKMDKFPIPVSIEKAKKHYKIRVAPGLMSEKTYWDVSENSYECNNVHYDYKTGEAVFAAKSKRDIAKWLEEYKDKVYIQE